MEDPSGRKITTSHGVKRWRCTECGYLFEGDEPPDVCPVCLAPRDAFVQVDYA